MMKARTTAGFVAQAIPGSSLSRLSPTALTVSEWLDSPYLARVAARVAVQYGVPPQDRPDLLQELRLALWKAGPELPVNVTWVFHTANHKAIDLLKRRRCLGEEELKSAERLPAKKSKDPSLLCLLRARAALLPGRLHDFYLLRYEEGLSQREIAARLGMCRGSVRCLDRRCLRMMKGRLASSPPLA
jgi:RNA polymerase sigma factor (sigma-70 family)